jgi:Uma2 family endonuclease
MGVEPDECFYIRRIDSVQGKKRLNLANDPAPDLLLEIDATNSSLNRLQVYTDLGVAEVWIYNGESLTIKQLQSGSYNIVSASQFFGNVPIADITIFSQQSQTVDYLELVKSFRDWVKLLIDV